MTHNITKIMKKPVFRYALLFAAPLLLGAALFAQQRGPRMIKHTMNEAKEVQLLPAESKAEGESRISIEVEGDKRVIRANAVPNHEIGQFPNRENPNRFAPMKYEFRFNANPKVADEITLLHIGNHDGPPNMPFGIAVNGCLFDPGTAEFWLGDRELDWNYDALGGSVPLGIDTNHAHVQHNGAYHYHGLPTGLLKELSVADDKHSPLVGWAADGFPIYALYGHIDGDDPKSAIAKLAASYRLRKGDRPDGDNGPGGKFDGAFTNDYEYVEGLGDLDQCNGRHTVTPEFPNGTYAYFLTDQWPYVPRNFRGTPVNLRGRGR